MSESPIYPLTPGDCDLRKFPHMQLDVARLRDSRFASHTSGEGFRAGVLLWAASWHQVPAGSVPNDLIELSQLAGFGRVTSEFQKLREEALYSFVLCSDGRYYHPVVAEKALAAWNEKLSYAYGKLADRQRKENKKREGSQLEMVAVPTFLEWKAEHFPQTYQFETRVDPVETHGADTCIPLEQGDFPSETFELSAQHPPEFQRKTLLKGEGEGEREGLINTNTPLPPDGGRQRKRKPSPDLAELMPAFEAFYAAYGRKIGRKAAEKAWLKLAPDAALQATILGAIAAQKPLRDHREGGRFIKHPATWLNGEHWNDEVPGATRPAPVNPQGEVWWQVAGFGHVAEAQNAHCHIGNYRQFRDGKRIDTRAPA